MFKKAKEESLTLTKELNTIIFGMKRERARVCENNSRTLAETGKELFYIEKRATELYKRGLDIRKSGSTFEEAQQLLNAEATCDTDRSILSRIFVKK